MLAVVDCEEGSGNGEGSSDGVLSLVGLRSVGLLRVWKKPFRDCWPLLVLVAAEERFDLLRLIGLLGDAEAEARRFSGELRLVTCVEFPFAIGDVCIDDLSAIELISCFASCVAVLEGTIKSPSVPTLVSASVDIGVETALGNAGFFPNMSRILLLFVNSVSSFPLSAGTSLPPSYSLCRTPSLNMPVGFIRSSICVSSSCFASSSTTP